MNLAANRPITWVGPMTFDVASARLQYSRVLIGQEELAVNIGDTVFFRLPVTNNSSAAVAGLNGVSFTSSRSNSNSAASSPTASNQGVLPLNGRNASNSAASANLQQNNSIPEFFFACGRVLQLWHNPRGKLERTASIHIFSQFEHFRPMSRSFPRMVEIRSSIFLRSFVN